MTSEFVDNNDDDAMTMQNTSKYGSSVPTRKSMPNTSKSTPRTRLCVTLATYNLRLVVLFRLLFITVTVSFIPYYIVPSENFLLRFKNDMIFNENSIRNHTLPNCPGLSSMFSQGFRDLDFVALFNCLRHAMKVIRIKLIEN